MANKKKESKIPKSYSSEDEMAMYELWEKSGKFNPDNIPSDKSPFLMTLPPPNANGDLHVGHTCGYSFQDAMGRYNRMKGHPTLLLPGKDHAGIQTEAVFTKVLKERGLDKWELGREKFYKKCYDFCTKNSENARSQEKRIGLSADWSREKFTLDDGLTETIYETFFKMFDDGLIYRGPYIVNQCTHCKTALADIDTEHKEKDGIFAFINYPLVDNSDKFITVATTRPETMLADTAVAVNPKDKRYKKLIGKKVRLPLTDRKIPIIAEESVDMETGTGALKVTPAHAGVDFEIAERHELEIINAIDETGHLNENAPEKYQGMTTKDAREAVLEDLEDAGLLEKTEKIQHEVLVCERCKTNIEQIISKQWFANVKPLADEVLKELKADKVKILPSGQKNTLITWLENIKPWCISRQLWWSHQMPIWYCGSRELHDWLLDNPDKSPKDYEKETGKKANGCGEIIPSVEKPQKCPKCGASSKDAHLEQETDVFDTWYSSGQWPYSTLGGPDGDDFKKFYPTQTMETMFDILFFWVARMLMLGLYRTGELPFTTVYLHGKILAPDGRKMSKSLGNGVMPTEIFRDYGADALRMWYYADTLPGHDSPIRYEKLQGQRNLVNKIWNASRFVMMQIEDLDAKEIKELDKLVSEKMAGLADSDDEWEKKTYKFAEQITGYLDKYRFNLAAETIREFFWHTFCDVWIEETKGLIDESPERKLEYLGRLIAILATQLKVIHPLAPFVTEKIWQVLRDIGLLQEEEELIMVEKWPIM